MKFSKKLVAIVSSAVAVVAIAVVAIVLLCGKSTSVKIDKSSNESYLKTSLQKALVDGIDNAYVSLSVLKNIDFSNVDADVKMNINFSDYAKNLLSHSLGIDVNWLNNVIINYNANINGGNESLELSLGMNDVICADADIRMNFAEDKVMLNSPILLKQPVVFPLEMDEMKVSDMLKNLNFTDKFIPSKNKLEKFLLDKIDIIFAQGFKVEANQDSTIEFATDYIVSLSDKQLGEIVVNLLNSLKNDPEFKEYVYNILKSFEMFTGNHYVMTDIDYYIDELISNIDVSSLSDDELLSLVFTFNQNDKIVLVDIENENFYINYESTGEGENVNNGLIVDFDEIGFAIVSTGTNKNGILNTENSFGVIMDGIPSEIFTVEYQDFDISNISKGISKGTSIINFSSDFFEEIQDYYGYYNSGLFEICDILPNLSFKTSFEGNAINNANSCIEVSYLSEPLATVDLKANIKKGKKVNIPSKDVIETTTNELLNVLPANLNLQNLINNLSEIGFPSEFLTYLFM